VPNLEQSEGGLDGTPQEKGMKQRSRLALVAILVFAAISSPVNAEPAESHEEDHHGRIPPEKVHRFEAQTVRVEDLEVEGYILAIGGGGEGVVGRLMGQQVIAIDISKRELEEAPAGPLKIVMDARDLKFVDGSFETAASFFTLMYIDGADHSQVLREVHRVLAPGGRFLIWDTVIGMPPSDQIEYVLVPLRIQLPDREISTGYGVRWPSEVHDVAYYKRLAEETGFVVAASRAEGAWFYLELTRSE
jgi:SAM-dependent methyltransferase